MAGKFEGLTDTEWTMFEALLPPLPAKRGRGQPPTDRRLVLNSILYILITGSRWCDLPTGEAWAPRSTSHRWMKTWSQDGTMEQVKTGMLQMAELAGKIDWSASSVDGSFSPR